MSLMLSTLIDLFPPTVFKLLSWIIKVRFQINYQFISVLYFSISKVTRWLINLNLGLFV